MSVKLKVLPHDSSYMYAKAENQSPLTILRHHFLTTGMGTKQDQSYRLYLMQL